MHPNDAWNYGVLGDAHIELGEYDAAFDAFDTMARHRPDAAAYGRIAYAQELQGHLDAAIASMRMAAEATGAQDPGVARLALRADREPASSDRRRRRRGAREFARAEHTLPGHPFAEAGRARVAAARGQSDEALAIYRGLMNTAPTSETAIAAGDLLAQNGDNEAADAMYARAEAIERDALADGSAADDQRGADARGAGVRTAEAVQLAEEAARNRKDIFTMDALAWAYYRAGTVHRRRSRVTPGAADRHGRSPHPRARGCYR